MKITVVLCTYNRCKSLQNALNSATSLTLPESVQAEILVVDNNSTDRTREVVLDFCHRYPGRFRYLFESQSGKSYALNAGIREAKGDIIAFMDDDVTLDPTWLANLTSSLHDEEWAGAGGRIVPSWSGLAPRWLSPTAWYAFGPLVQFDAGDQPGPLAKTPFGTNMAFRKSMFSKYGGFRTDLGPRPGNEGKNEDTEFSARLFAAGERLRYEPSAVVYHPVQKERLTRKYFLGWWFLKGQADFRLLGIRPESKYSFAGIPLYLLRNLAVALVKWMYTIGSSQRFGRKLEVWTTVGEIYECCRQSSHSGDRTEDSGTRMRAKNTSASTNPSCEQGHL